MRLRYQTQYFYVGSNPHRRPDAYGHGNNLTSAIRNSAGRCAVEQYNKAVIYDRRTGKRVRVLTRNAGGISIHTGE